jgi:tRNA (guanine-N7-)-methyltransferase
VLELGCGKGEYTVGLARLFPDKNFIGIDIKGARMWRGAKTSNEDQILNSAFLRTRIEFIDSFFAAGEVDEVWITFPDPQLKSRRVKKRLTNAAFLNEYRKFMVDGGLVHLKTDSKPLYDYTLQLAQSNNLEILVHTDDLYNSLLPEEVPDIRTFYENEYLIKGYPITYLKFRLKPDKEIIELVVSG